MANRWPWMSSNGHGGDGTVTDRERLAVLNDGMSSLAFARQSFLDSLSDPRRSIDAECGYPENDTDVSIQLYRNLYDREAIATRIVQVYPRESWQMSPMVYDDEDPDKETDFEKAWDDLGRTLASGSSGSQSWHGEELGSPIWEYLRRADELSGIGHFGVILLGIDDGRNLQDPVDGVMVMNTAGCGDSYMSEEEEAALRNPPTRQVWNGRYEKVGRDTNPLDKRLEPILEDYRPKPLNSAERQVVDNWAQGRERVMEAQRLAKQIERRILSRNPEAPVDPPMVLTANEAKQIAHEVHNRLVDNARRRVDISKKKNPYRQPDKRGSAKAISRGAPSTVPFSQENVGGQSESQQSRSPADVLGYSQAFGSGMGNSPTASNPGNTYPPTGQEAASGQYGQKTSKGGFKLGGPPDGQGYGGSYGYPPSGDDGSAQSSDYAYGGSGQGATAPGSSLAGTDQQYFGVQYGPSEAFGAQPTKQHRLLFVRCFDESLVQIVRYEWNVRNPRFGLPVMYRITLNDPREQHSGIGLPLATVFVHWSRVIHIADNLSSSEIFGVPRMRPVLNAVLDDRKIAGSSAEGYFRAGCSPVYSMETHPTLGGDVELDKPGLQDMVENVTNSLQRWMITSGLSVKTLPPAVIDPKSYHDIQVEKICIQLAMPVRVFKGSERGELASSQDDETWNERVAARRQFYLTPRVIVPFIDRLIQIGVLPEPENEDGYTVHWPDAEVLNDKDKAAVGFQNTQALSAFIAGNGESIMTVKDFLTNPKFMNMEDEEAEAIIDATQKTHDDQETMTNPPMIQGQPAAPAKGTAADAQQQAQQEQAKQASQDKIAQMKLMAQQKQAVGPGGEDKMEQEADNKADEEPSDNWLIMNAVEDEPRDEKGRWTGEGTEARKAKLEAYHKQEIMYGGHSIKGADREEFEKLKKEEAQEKADKVKRMAEADGVKVVKGASRTIFKHEDGNRYWLHVKAHDGTRPGDTGRKFSADGGRTWQSYAHNAIAVSKSPPIKVSGNESAPTSNECLVFNAAKSVTGARIGCVELANLDLIDFVLNESDSGTWITLKGGTHILLKAGQSAGQAIKEHFKERESQRQSAKSKPPHGAASHGGGEHGKEEHGHGHELEHAAHEVHTAHEAYEVAEAAGLGHEAHEGAVEAHHVAEAFGGSHEAHEATQAAHEAGQHALESGEHLEHPSGLDAAAIVARHAYGPALKAAAHLVSKVPGGEKTANMISDLHDGATKLADAAVGRLVKRYGHATAAAILGAGSLTSKSTVKAIGIPGSVASAIPGHQFIGAIPLLAVAETGKRLGLVGPDSRLEKGLAHMGTWVHAVRHAVGRPFNYAAKKAEGLFHRGARAAGKLVRRLTGNELIINADGVDPSIDLDRAAAEFWKDYQDECQKMANEAMAKAKGT